MQRHATARARGTREQTRVPELDLSVLRGMFGFSVRMAQLRLYKHFHRQLWRRHHLHPGAFAALAAIGNNPGVRPGRLADALAVKRPNMTKLLDTLDRRGWVERRGQAGDGRGVALHLTAAGERRIARLLREVRALDLQSTAVLSRRERALAIALLDKVATSLE